MGRIIYGWISILKIRVDGMKQASLKSMCITYIVYRELLKLLKCIKILWHNNDFFVQLFTNISNINIFIIIL